MADKDGRYLFVNGLLDTQPVTIATFYAPNEHQVVFLEDAFNKLQQFGMGNVIWGGGGFEYDSRF